MISELQQIILNTILYRTNNFEFGLIEWGKRVKRFTGTFAMAFPEHLLYMLLLQGAPDRHIGHHERDQANQAHRVSGVM